MKDKSNLSKTFGQNVYLKIFNYLILFIGVFIILMPILIMVNISFKTDKEFLYSGILQLPENIFNFSNYITVFEKGKMLLAFKNTIILIVIPVIASVVMGSMVAYILDRFDFRFKKLALLAFVIPSVIPSITTQVATFSVISGLNLYNTIFAGILLYLATDVIQIYLFMQFINKVPYSLDESARIDGASNFKIYWSIILPQLKPAIVTVAIIKVITIYNDMFIPYMYMPKASLKTVTTALMSFSNDRVSQWNIMAAGIILVMIPTLLLYLFSQKYIISGVTSGATKE